MSSELQQHPYASLIYAKLLSHIHNHYGVSALMGNLQAESGLYPDRVQGDIPYSEWSKEYTAAVDSGGISESKFVNYGPNGGGYGLAQWTYPSRKQELYNMYKTGGYESIGSVDLACDFLVYELKTSYSGVWNALVNATEIRTPSNKVLHDFENPADQSAEVEKLRASMGAEIYNTFSGGSYEEPTDTPTNKNKKLSKLLLWAIVSDTF